jgi:hypothetical protein
LLFITEYIPSGIRMTHVLGFGTVGKMCQQAGENEHALFNGKEGKRTLLRFSKLSFSERCDK